LGGRKKPTISQLEKRMKRVSRKDEGKKEAKRAALRAKMITGEGLSLKSLEELYKDIKGLNFLTPYSLATRYKIKISTAKRLLRELENEGLVKLMLKSRRAPIYIPVVQR